MRSLCLFCGALAQDAVNIVCCRWCMQVLEAGTRQCCTSCKNVCRQQVVVLLSKHACSVGDTAQRQLHCLPLCPLIASLSQMQPLVCAARLAVRPAAGLSSVWCLQQLANTLHRCCFDALICLYELQQRTTQGGKVPLAMIQQL